MGGNMNEWMGEFGNDWVSEIVHGEEKDGLMAG